MCYNEKYIRFTEIEATRAANSGFVSPGIACFHIDASEVWSLEWAGWCCAPGAAAVVPLQGQGSAVPAAVPISRVLSDSSVEQTSITWESKVNAIRFRNLLISALSIEAWSPSLL